MGISCNNLPEKFLDRLKRIYTEEEYNQVLNAFANKPLPSFRVNTLKTNTTDLTKKLEHAGFIVKQSKWYSDAFILKNRSVRELTDTNEYKEGLLYIQNLSSMIPALVLDPQPGEKVLDLAAAPGSKTTQMAAMMQNTGEIVANDTSRARLYKMEAILKQYGIPFRHIKTHPNRPPLSRRRPPSSGPLSGREPFWFSPPDKGELEGVFVVTSRGESLWKRYSEYFDKTLVDVPCTMEGRIQCDDPRTYEDWSTKKIKQLSMLQKYLLRSAISATKPGGTIVYSTCTLAPEENEEVIDWIIKREGDNIQIEEIHINGLTFNLGISSWNKPFNPKVTKTARITPSKTMEGFFVAKIRKLRSTLPNQDFI